MNEIKTSDGRILKQVGVMSERTEDGAFLPSKPVYIIVSENEVDSDTGMLPQEEKTNSDIAKLLAGKMKEYVEGCKARGVKIDL